jgi:predicted RNA binding protein YcfA (HicA-like mRNA interferase family)
MRILRAMGAVERAGKGSHVRFTIGACSTTVPNHKGEDIRKGTLAAIEASMEPCLGRDWLKRIIRDGRWRSS